MVRRPTKHQGDDPKRKMLRRLLRFFEQPGLDRQLKSPPNRPKLSESVSADESKSEPFEPPIDYVPPPDETVEQWAKAVSQHMAELKDDPRFTQPEVRHGLTSFMKLVAKVKAQQLNGQIDDSEGDE